MDTDTNRAGDPDPDDLDGADDPDPDDLDGLAASLDHLRLWCESEGPLNPQGRHLPAPFWAASAPAVRTPRTGVRHPKPARPFHAIILLRANSPAHLCAAVRRSRLFGLP
jgi:hypothetical protein